MSFNFQSSSPLPFHCKLMTSFLISQRDNDNMRFCSPPQLGKALSVGTCPLSPVTVGRFPSLHLYSGQLPFPDVLGVSQLSILPPFVSLSLFPPTQTWLCLPHLERGKALLPTTLITASGFTSFLHFTSNVLERDIYLSCPYNPISSSALQLFCLKMKTSVLLH